MASSSAAPKTSATTKMTTTTAMTPSPKIPPSSSALATWSYSPLASFRSGMTTPGSVGDLSVRRSSTNFITPGKSLAESIVTLTLIGVASILLASLDTLLGGVIVSNLALLAGLYAYQWTQVHSYKLDPRCSIILDEANVLSITSNFDHEMLGFIERLEPTKKPSESAEAQLKPKSLWDALFFDDRRYKIEEFYRGVYGNEYAVAKKREEEEMEDSRQRIAAAATSVQKTQEMSDEQRSPSDR
ncbi:hypothetical protein PRIPAC_70405 [Pristionchus pacificus]|uniref:Uncharacterized protein n=1 Tax=Pristionchus pacificus TaxID=54126 RepID=A0A2A6C7I9_PRIPA|nr:hypothetical protein PRIPAC_70405 [Pristionchus pacificus]|eukprot:PDM74144.1 hypothetical protein PRIPAC_41500 [Pristionchus pacificus]